MPSLKRTRAILVAMILALALSSCGKQAPAITVGGDLGDFTIEDGQVLMRCHIVLSNVSSEDRYVVLRAESLEDVIGGLLKTPKMYSAGQYFVPAGESASYEVTFIGEHAGGTQKLDRLLPDIYVTEVDGKPLSQ